MKIPKRIADILKRRQEFIDAQRAKMENTVIRLQSQLFSDLVEKLIPELDVEGGVIKESAKNYRLLSVLDKAYKDFQTGANTVIFEQIIAGTTTIAALAEKQFKVVLSGDIPARFETVIAKTDKLINLRLGLDGGKLVNGGYLKSFFESNTIGTELKEMASKAVTSQMSIKDFVKILKEKINGTAEGKGVMERQFQRYAFDLYQQYDSAYNKTLGDEFGFRYFIYQGGLIRDSRDFCAAHNNKVWSVDEAQEWATWTPSQGEYPEGYEIKQKDIYAVPSYLGYAGYDPLVDRGGYNCRHSLGYIPDELAMELRKDLKD